MFTLYVSILDPDSDKVMRQLPEYGWKRFSLPVTNFIARAGNGPETLFRWDEQLNRWWH